jgi:hypothetical protein
MPGIAKSPRGPLDVLKVTTSLSATVVEAFLSPFAFVAACGQAVGLPDACRPKSAPHQGRNLLVARAARSLSDSN